MTDVVQLVSIVVSASLLVTIIELVRRRRLSEEYSLIWIVCAVALFALSLWRNVLDLAASALGVHYPPAVLLLVLTFFVVIVSLYFSVVVSRHRQDIEKLVEEVALLDEQVRRLRSSALILPADAELRPPDTENHIEH
jgi:hypothetical protein